MDSNVTKSGRPHRPILPWKTRTAFLFLNSVTYASLRRDGTVNRRLLRFLESLGIKVPANPKPRGGVKTCDVTVDSSRDLWFRVFVPCHSHLESDARLPVVVFFHGGGFVFLAPYIKAYDDVCRRLARELPAVVVSVNYRLAPEHRFPAPYDDGFDVLKFLDEQCNVLPENADVSYCFLAGDSAGGNLAHHVAKRACESRLGRLKVVGVIAIQPFFGGEERTKAEMELAKVDLLISMKRTDWMWKALIPGSDRDHESINISGPRAADISALNFPATMVVVAGFDSLRDWQIRYYEWLKRSGKEAYVIEYPNMVHAFYIFPELPESGQFIAEAKRFVHQQLSKSPIQNGELKSPSI